MEAVGVAAGATGAGAATAALGDLGGVGDAEGTVGSDVAGALAPKPKGRVGGAVRLSVRVKIGADTFVMSSGLVGEGEAAGTAPDAAGTEGTLNWKGDAAVGTADAAAGDGVTAGIVTWKGVADGVPG
uniref:Uncharacterized protein n=1 Tax=Haptolina brevifila TaxID=156173 RepID=A0A7S2E275_9EUKA